MKHLMLIIAASLTTFAPCAKGVAEENDYLGRWNIEIQDTGDTFSSAWLRVTNDKGTLGGELMWKWGSVTPIKDVAIDENGLQFARGKDKIQATIVDGELHGVATTGEGDRFNFLGQRSQELCDATGTWQTKLATDDETDGGTIVLKRDGEQITGTAHDPQGFKYAVQDAKLDGRMLSLKAVPKDFDAPPRVVQCEIRGDALVGVVKVPVEGESELRELPITGQRQRAWGTPVALLQQDGLEGWGPRDTTKKFGWTVQDGVLQNSPPDVDIMSAAKFRDFRLQLEYKVEPRSNSGVYLRGRYELQILGDTRVQDHGNMAVYSRLKPNKNPLRPGEWNELEVTLIGRWLTVVLNGETVHDNQYLEGPTGGAWDPSEEKPGPLLLQGDHGKVMFRNIVVTPAE